MENLQQTQLPENLRYTTKEDQELDYWSKEFGISKDELAEAVKAGVTSTTAVENYVKRMQLAD